MKILQFSRLIMDKHLRIPSVRRPGFESLSRGKYKYQLSQMDPRDAQ